MAASMVTTGDRPFPLPAAPWVMWQEWRHLLFAHWPLPPEILAKWLPQQLSLDTYNNQAWLGAVMFKGLVAPRGLHWLKHGIPFYQLNLRTYVTYKNKPGVFFFSLDATEPLSVRGARWLYHLPYRDAAIQMSDTPDGHYRFDLETSSTQNSEFSAEYRPTSPVFYASPASLESWLTDRYIMYSTNLYGHLHSADIYHEPWPLQRAEGAILKDSLLTARNLLPSVTAPPHLLYVEAQEMIGWLPQKLTG